MGVNYFLATAAESAWRGKFMVRCLYAAPAYISGVIEREHDVTVPFEQLQRRDGVSFYFDTAGERERAWAARECEIAERERRRAADEARVAASADGPHFAAPTKDRADRVEQLVAMLLDSGVAVDHPRVALARWLATRPGQYAADRVKVKAAFRDAQRTFADEGFTLPITRSREFGKFEWRAMALFSAELGVPVGYEFVALVQVAHRIAYAHRPALTSFVHVARHFGSYAAMLEHDREGKWWAKIEAMRNAARYRATDPSVWEPYEPESWWRSLCRVAYPEIPGLRR